MFSTRYDSNQSVRPKSINRSSISNVFIRACIVVCGLASASAADSGVRLHFSHTSRLSTPILRHSFYHHEYPDFFRQRLRCETPIRRLVVSRFHQLSDADTVFHRLASPRTGIINFEDKCLSGRIFNRVPSVLDFQIVSYPILRPHCFQSSLEVS